MKRLVLLALLAGCSPAPEEAQVRQEPVVVYAAYEDEMELVAAFDRYKEETGVLVIVRRGPPDRIVSDLIENNISPPADVLMTESVVGAWQAAEESALRPVVSDQLAQRVPEWARDPDNLWFATAVNRVVIAYSGEAPAALRPADLASNQYGGKLCLSSSKNAINRALIATLIDKSDVRTAEITVRGWIRNLALPPIDTEEKLLAAIAEGRCAIGVASHDAASASGVKFVEPASLYADAATMGVARHAHNPDGAAALVEWLAQNFSQELDAAPALSNVGLVAWHYEEAVKLAERARYP